FGPTMPRASPSSTVRLTSSIALSDPKDFETPWSSTRAGKHDSLAVFDRQELSPSLEAGDELVRDDRHLVLVRLALPPLTTGEPRLADVRHGILRIRLA